MTGCCLKLNNGRWCQPGPRHWSVWPTSTVPTGNKPGPKPKPLIDGKKQCSKCRVFKIPADFHRDRGLRLGIKSSCKACERRLVPSATQRMRVRRNILPQRYGITLDDYNRMFVNQNGCCAICKRPELMVNNDGTRRQLAIDHNHATGQVRGLLCDHCNKAIGLLRDDPAVVAQAVTYLQHYQQYDHTSIKLA